MIFKMFVLPTKRAWRAFLLLTAFLAVVCSPAAGQTPTPLPMSSPAPTPLASPAPEATTKPVTTGKPPVIIIPGLIGSELVNKSTGETVWFNIQRSKTDDLRLPISMNLRANKDDLEPGDIIRNIKYLKFLPETEIYQNIASSLVLPGAYREGNWDTPGENDFQDAYYVFPYDWRRDNIETAQLLIGKINALKLKLKRPDLKFNIVAHSMGGLIARYAAMYGDADLPRGTRRIVPTWAGAKSINKVFLVGTPNEGSVPSLSALLNGYGITRINLPFVQSITRFDMFTIPSIYQLLPHGGTLRAFDENLKPLRIDIYSPATWEKYGWAAYTDPRFSKEFTIQEQAQAKAYFRIVLNRAKRFHQALDGPASAQKVVPMYVLGSDCKPTLDGVIIRRDEKKNRWRTDFDPEGFKRPDGTKVTGKELEAVLYTLGDGVVTQRSLLTSDLPGARMQGKYKAAIPLEDVSFACAPHTVLLSNTEVQTKLFADLVSKQK